MTSGRGFRIPGRVAAIAACALAAHGLVYRTLAPVDGMHGYFLWYEPVVALASVLSLLGLLALVLAVLRGRTSFVPARPAPLGELFGSTLLFLLAQESLERSVAQGRPAVAAFAPTGWLAVVAATALAALLRAAAQRLGRAAVGRLLTAHRPVRAVTSAPQRWRVVLASPPRPRPLAERFGLRAPPPRFALR